MQIVKEASLDTRTGKHAERRYPLKQQGSSQRSPCYRHGSQITKQHPTRTDRIKVIQCSFLQLSLTISFKLTRAICPNLELLEITTCNCFWRLSPWQFSLVPPSSHVVIYWFVCLRLLLQVLLCRDFMGFPTPFHAYPVSPISSNLTDPSAVPYPKPRGVRRPEQGPQNTKNSWSMSNPAHITIEKNCKVKSPNSDAMFFGLPVRIYTCVFRVPEIKKHHDSMKWLQFRVLTTLHRLKYWWNKSCISWSWSFIYHYLRRVLAPSKRWLALGFLKILVQPRCCSSHLRQIWPRTPWDFWNEFVMSQINIYLSGCLNQKSKNIYHMMYRICIYDVYRYIYSLSRYVCILYSRCQSTLQSHSESMYIYIYTYLYYI